MSDLGAQFAGGVVGGVIGGTAATVGLKVGGIAWQSTRAELNVSFENKQNEYKLYHFIRHCKSGECVRTARFELPPNQTETVRFRNRAVGYFVEGCAVYGLCPVREQPTERKFYLAVGWSIGAKCESLLYVGLFEVAQAQMPNSNELKRLFNTEIKRNLSPEKDVHYFFKPINDLPTIRVVGRMNDLLKEGQIDITITADEGDPTPPKMWNQMSNPRGLDEVDDRPFQKSKSSKIDDHESTFRRVSPGDRLFHSFSDALCSVVLIGLPVFQKR